jgi:hypothetical protein
MTATFKLGLIFLLFSYACQTEKNNENSENASIDTIISTNTLDSSTIEKTEQNPSPFQQELNKALNDPTINKYYKDIYRQEKLISADDNIMLSITDSLNTKNPDTDLFYFIVFTKSMNGSDGFYSEAVGLSAFSFVTTQTEKFADYFNIAPKLNDKDLDNWANYVYGEIQISREGEEKKAVKELEDQLLENIKGARKEYDVVIKQFIEKIKSTMP